MDIKSLKIKIYIAVLIPFLVLIYFAYSYVESKYIQYQKSQYVERATRYVEVSSKLIQELQKERGVSIGYIAGGSFFKKNLTDQRYNTDRAYQSFLRTALNLDLNDNKEKVKRFLEKYKAVSNLREMVDSRDISAVELLKGYSGLTQQLIDYTSFLKSPIINEDFFELADNYLTILQITEESGKERALISFFIVKKDKDRAILEEMKKIDSTLQVLYKRFQNSYNERVLHIFNGNISKEDFSKYLEYKNRILNRILTGLKPKEWWSVSTGYIDSLYAVNQEVLKELSSLKSSIEKEAFESLVKSQLMLAICFFALMLTLWYINRLLKAYDRQKKFVVYNKKLYKVFGEYLEVLLFNNHDEISLESLPKVLKKLEFFKYLFVAKVDKNCNIEPIVAEGISKSSIEQTAKGNGNYKELKSSIKDVCLRGKFKVLKASDFNKDTLLHSEVSYIGVFPMGDYKEISYVFVAALKNGMRFDYLLTDYLNRMTSACKFALEKILIQEKEKMAKKELMIMARAFDSHEAITVTDEAGNIIKTNDAFEKITGYKKSEVIGRNPSILKSGIHERDFYERMWSDIKREGYWKGEIYNKRKNGEIYPEMLSISAVRNEEGEVTNYVAHFFDITDLKNAQKEAEYRAQHDYLTGLLNRRKLNEELERVFVESKKNGEFCAFIYIDIDNFKQINDLYTHEAGDKVLIETSGKLKSLKYEKDLIGRWGGDEFAFVSVGLGKSKVEAIKRVSILLEKIDTLFKDPIAVNGSLINISFSIGVKLFPDKEKSKKEVVACADIAMYHAKKSGKNQYSIFDERLDIQAKEFIVLKNEFKKALDSEQIIAHYQPKVKLFDRSICGFEALVRWQHPKKGLLFPGLFLSVIESNRLAFELTLYMIKTVGIQVKRWSKELEGFNHRVAVNISAAVFNSDSFYKEVKKSILDYNLDASLLEFEIVEDILMRDVDRAIETINKFKDMGITFAIDDFGTGYSSFNYLKKLPVDTLKIDRSFLENLERSHNRDIVKMLVEATKIFNMKSVAEGVETKEVEEFLKDIGCNAYQGYFFSKPIDSSEVEKFWEKWQKSSIVA